MPRRAFLKLQKENTWIPQWFLVETVSDICRGVGVANRYCEPNLAWNAYFILCDTNDERKERWFHAQEGPSLVKGVCLCFGQYSWLFLFFGCWD